MTSDTRTIARPYAVAAFEIALESRALASWANMLESAALLLAESRVIALLSNPAVSRKKTADFFCDVLSTVLDTEKKRFLCLLADNKRLPVLPAIATLFASYQAAHEEMITVEVISAVALEDAYQQKLAAGLTKRLQRQVILACTVDAALIGGVVVRAGDQVIDGSVRGKLNRLCESL